MVEIIFHGTRGSFPTSSPAHTKYGGHTSCISILTQSHWVVFDAGTGLIDAGDIAQKHHFLNCNLLLSHLHLDHVVGLPSFSALWDSNFTINIYSATPNSKDYIRQIISPPYFPVDWDHIPATRTISEFTPGTTLSLDQNSCVETIALSHPGGSCGYKLNMDGQVICYISDTDLSAELRSNLISFITNCDLLIFDSTYCNSEYAPVAHFGHSTWQMACDIANEANVKLLALYHHDPKHTDDLIDQIEFEAKDIFTNTFAARCGQRLTLPK